MASQTTDHPRLKPSGFGSQQQQQQQACKLPSVLRQGGRDARDTFSLFLYEANIASFSYTKQVLKVTLVCLVCLVCLVFFSPLQYMTVALHSRSKFATDSRTCVRCMYARNENTPGQLKQYEFQGGYKGGGDSQTITMR